MHVSAAMTRGLPSCGPFEPLPAVARALGRSGVGCLAVLAADGSRRVLGLVTDRDVARAMARDGEDIGEIQARSAMSLPPACAPGDSLRDALARMRASGAKRLPVVDPAGRLVGLLSLAGIAAAVVRGAADPSLQYEIVDTLRAPARRRVPSGSLRRAAAPRGGGPAPMAAAS